MRILIPWMFAALSMVEMPVFIAAQSGTLPLPPRVAAPDMSGTWLLIDPSTAAAAAAREIRVVQDEHSFSVTATGGTMPGTGKHELSVLGGVVDSRGAQRGRSSAVRDSSVVVESSYRPADGDRADSTWYAETWTVAGNRLTVRVQERRNDRATLDATLVYRRQ